MTHKLFIRVTLTVINKQGELKARALERFEKIFDALVDIHLNRVGKGKGVMKI